jgi:hypothetical protein
MTLAIGRRWLPCAGLAGGALVQAALTVLLIPDRLGTSSFESEQRWTPVSEGAPARFQYESPRAPAPAPAPSPEPAAVAGGDGVVRSIFAPPPMELPVAPPDPAPLLELCDASSTSSTSGTDAAPGTE